MDVTNARRAMPISEVPAASESIDPSGTSAIPAGTTSTARAIRSGARVARRMRTPRRTDADDRRSIEAEGVEHIDRPSPRPHRSPRRDAVALAGLSSRAGGMDPHPVGERREPGERQRTDDIAAWKTTSGGRLRPRLKDVVSPNRVDTMRDVVAKGSAVAGHGRRGPRSRDAPPRIDRSSCRASTPRVGPTPPIMRHRQRGLRSTGLEEPVDRVPRDDRGDRDADDHLRRLDPGSRPVRRPPWLRRRAPG